MKTFSVAKVRASLASLLVRAQTEVVVIARYGKPIGLLLGLPPSARIEEIKSLAGQVHAARRRGLRAALSASAGSSTTLRNDRQPKRDGAARKRR